jgi:hypothetical protein
MVLGVSTAIATPFAAAIVIDAVEAAGGEAIYGNTKQPS